MKNTGKRLTNSLPTSNYAKGAKPALPVNRKAPVVAITKTKAALGENVLPKNKAAVTDSHRIQKANALPGRAGSGGGKPPFAK